MLGDCLDVMRDMSDGSVDLTVTSPPYDNLRTYNGTLNDWTQEKWQAIIRELFRVTKQGGVVVWVVADATIKGSETGTSFRQALYAMDCGFRLHDTMIWGKPNPIPRTHNRYEQAFEYMFVLAKGKPATWSPVKVPSKLAGKPRTGTMQHDASGVRATKHKGGVTAALKVPGNVWLAAGESKTSHPAPFPEALAHDHIISWSNTGDTVLDPFMGSGTTGVACVKTKRDFIGIELDDVYLNHGNGAAYFLIGGGFFVAKKGGENPEKERFRASKRLFSAGTVPRRTPVGSRDRSPDHRSKPDGDRRD